MQPLLILPFAVFLIVILLLFYKEHSRSESKHLQNLNRLNKLIFLNKKQINYREKGLQLYNFTLYNLEESLRVQANIKLN